MELRDFGKRSGFQVAPVSIGAMRLPDDYIDSVELLRHAIDSGMRYIDTSRGYTESEVKVGVALRDGYREKVIVSSKSSPWITKIQDSDDGTADCMRRRIEESLVRFGLDYLDFYQVWNVQNPEEWEIATRKGGMVEGIKKAKEEGLVGHIGFTAHDSPENLMRYFDEADWCEILLVSYNMLNRTYEPALQRAGEKGIGTVVMNPVGGGKLAKENAVLGALAAEVGAASVADLAIRYVLANPHVMTLLCGMTKLSDVDDSVASAERGPLSADQVGQVHEFFEKLSRENIQFCTNCNYCQPCPQGVKIPAIMDMIYEKRFLGFEPEENVLKWLTDNAKPQVCTKCGECETKCTQGLKIIEEIEYALAQYDEKG